jgi:hypothetical protein
LRSALLRPAVNTDRADLFGDEVDRADNKLVIDGLGSHGLHFEAFLHANYRSAPPDPELSGYAHTLVKGQRFQEAINVSAMLENPNTLGALNYRGYAMRKLGRTEAS